VDRHCGACVHDCIGVLYLTGGDIAVGIVDLRLSLGAKPCVAVSVESVVGVAYSGIREGEGEAGIVG